MPPTAFTEDEMQAFEAVFEARTDWVSWRRRGGTDGRDFLEVHSADERSPTLRLIKTGAPVTYLVAGLNDWNLAICANFEEMMRTVANASMPRSAVA